MRIILPDKEIHRGNCESSGIMVDTTQWVSVVCSSRLNRFCLVVGVLIPCLSSPIVAQVPPHPPATLGVQVQPVRLPLAARQATPLERASWPQLLVRDRKLEIQLRNIDRLLQAREVHTALAEIQSILNRPQDGFVLVDEASVPVGAQQVIGGVLSRQPSEVLAAYEALFGSEAARMLDQARQTGDPALSVQVVRRFFHTTSGFEAANWLATRWMDRGAWSLAADLWRRVLAEPVHQPRLQAVHRLKAALCLQRLGATAESEQVAAVLQSSAVQVAGGSVPATSWLTTAAASYTSNPREISGPSGRLGHRSGHGMFSAVNSAPLLRIPRWTQPLSEAQSRTIDSLLQGWTRYREQQNLPVGTAQFPIVVGDQLVCRNFEGLIGIDLSTGTRRWAYPCVSSLWRDVASHLGSTVEGNPDPGHLGRLWVGNALLGLLTSDGQRVYAIDQLESNWNQQSNTIDQTPDPVSVNRRTNTLLAIDLSQAAGTDVHTAWRLGGPDNSQQLEKLPGHFFLGAPLPVGDRLFVLSEYDQELMVSCLQPLTGERIWSQEIGASSTPINYDQQRYYLDCGLTYQAGVLVCPTQSGVIVGLDPIDGTLLWATSYEDPQQRHQFSMWSTNARRRYAQPGYPNVPVVSGNSLISLPAHSDSILCLDIQTGHLRWRRRREDLDDSMEYVAAATPQTVLVVGQRRCVGISIETGAESWSTPLASIPVGRGARLKDAYLLPLAAGELIQLDVDTGARTGVLLSNARQTLGNLVVGGDVVVSLGTDGLTAYPQAGPELATLLAREASQPLSSIEQLRIAECQLAVSRPEQARGRLDSVLQIDSLPDGLQPTATSLLRELLYDELRQPGGNRSETLARLEELAETPEQQGRYLIQRIRYERDFGTPESTLAVAQRLLRLQIPGAISVPEDPARALSPATWVRNVLSVRAASPMIESLVRRTLDSTLASDDIHVLREALFLYGDHAGADPDRLRVAQLLWSQGEYQAAEFVLLQCRQSSDPPVAGTALRFLAEIWDECGLYIDSARALRDLSTQFAKVAVGDGMTGRSYVEGFSRDRLSWSAYRNLQAPQWSKSQILITDERWPNEDLQSSYHANSIQPLRTPVGFAFDLFYKGRGNEGQFVAIEKHTGVELQPPLDVNGRYTFPSNVQQTFVGHCFPIGTAGGGMGVSLLEGRMLDWQQAMPPELQHLKGLFRAGPASPEFCTFQHQQHLVVIDPATGRLLWHRNDLDARSGLMLDTFSGMFGDNHVLVVFAGDRSSYTLYDTLTGAELRRGRLDVDHQQTHQVFGRHLFHFTSSAGARRLRIWDPLTDAFLWEEPADNMADASLLAGVAVGTKIYSFVYGTDQLAYVNKAGHLRVVSAGTGTPVLDVPFTPRQLENLGGIRAFRDRGQYYVNLHHIARSRNPGPMVAFRAVDSALPSVHIQGELCAIDPQKQQVTWSEEFGSRTILQVPDYELPVLLSICRVNRDNQLVLRVDVVDRQTGKVLASRDDLLADRLLQLSYDRDAATLELFGLRSTVRLQFAPEQELQTLGQVRRP